MIHRTVIPPTTWLAAAAVAAAVAGCGTDWRPLFNGRDLEGWYSWQDGRGKNADTAGMFTVKSGEIHILDTDLAPGQFSFAYLATTEEFENFRARFEYRWGSRMYVNFGPDSGFFLHAVGPDRIWPRSIECQVMRGDTGSMYLFDYATIDTRIDPAAAAPTYLPGGKPYTAPRNPEPDFARVTHDSVRDDPIGWNTVEVIAVGADVQFIVNGHTTFRGSGLRQPDPAAPDDPSRDIPLARGKIVLQQEGSEVWYRNLEIQDL